MATHLTYDKIVCTIYTWNMLYLDRNFDTYFPNTSNRKPQFVRFINNLYDRLLTQSLSIPTVSIS
ncbi:hypothetical protein [Microcoleus sp. Z1_C3]|uniref:hypothetical protein n=1 Tax=unclassified Microcoleus TaxID=2642155 RepID=UPI002FD5B949